METKSQFFQNVYAISDRIWWYTNLRIQPWENMKTMGKVDTSDLMMIIIWVITISFRTPKIAWDSWTHPTPYIVMDIKVNERTNCILDTPPQKKTQQAFTCNQRLWAVLPNDDNGREYTGLNRIRPCGQISTEYDLYGRISAVKS